MIFEACRYNFACRRPTYRRTARFQGCPLQQFQSSSKICTAVSNAGLKSERDNHFKTSNPFFGFLPTRRFSADYFSKTRTKDVELLSSSKPNFFKKFVSVPKIHTTLLSKLSMWRCVFVCLMQVCNRLTSQTPVVQWTCYC